MGLLDVLNGMQNGPRGPSHSERAIRRRDVADDHGDPGAACLQGRQAHRRRLAGPTSGTDAGAGGTRRTWPAVWWRRWSWRPPQGRTGRPACRRRGRQRHQRRTGRPAQAISAERPRRHRQFMGEPGPEQADRARRSRQRARRRSDQQPDVAKRPVARGTAERPQPASARGGQPSDAGRTAADRRRSWRAGSERAGRHRDIFIRAF